MPTCSECRKYRNPATVMPKPAWCTNPVEVGECHRVPVAFPRQVGYDPKYAVRLPYVWADAGACPDFEYKDWARRVAERICKIGFVYGPETTWGNEAAKIIHEEMKKGEEP